MAAFVEALVGEEFEPGGGLHLHAVGDLALEIGGVGAQRLEYRLFVLAEQRLLEHRRVPEVGRHAHLGDRDHVAGQRVVMHVAALEDLAQDMAHLFAAAQRADGFGFGGVVLTIHKTIDPASRAKGVSRKSSAGKLPAKPPSMPATSQRGQGLIRRRGLSGEDPGEGGPFGRLHRLFGIYSVRSRSSTSKVSRKSPGLMSTKFCVKVTPHSRPARTSATSSLKRRSDAISPW